MCVCVRVCVCVCVETGHSHTYYAHDNNISSCIPLCVYPYIIHCISTVYIYLSPERWHLSIVYACEHLFQLRRHHHQSLDTFLQFHQRTSDGGQQNIVALYLYTVGGGGGGIMNNETTKQHNTAHYNGIRDNSFFQRKMSCSGGIQTHDTLFSRRVLSYVHCLQWNTYAWY